VLFRSAAQAFGAQSIGIVLSGTGHDGAAGLAAIKVAGGVTLVQTPMDARFPMMPMNALAAVAPDACVPAEQLGPLVDRFARERAPAVPGTGRAMASPGGRRPRRLSLRNLRVFVAEDEYLIAAELVGMLRELGCSAAGPVPDVAAGLRLLEREHGQLDCAVLDVDLRGETALPLASALQKQGVPLVFATGCGRGTGGDRPRCAEASRPGNKVSPSLTGPSARTPSGSNQLESIACGGAEAGAGRLACQP
jgi:CheY-like chemotaxis protein